LNKACQLRGLPVDVWKADERLATKERGELLNIFDLNHQKLPILAQITV
jgi:hypothetical protein